MSAAVALWRRHDPEPPEGLIRDCEVQYGSPFVVALVEKIVGAGKLAGYRDCFHGFAKSQFQRQILLDESKQPEGVR